VAEENYFRYARAHFALDALDSYAVTRTTRRLVPNPAKKTASAAVSAAKKDLAAAGPPARTRSPRCAARPPAPPR